MGSARLPSLIRFWVGKRKKAGLSTEVRPFHKQIAKKLTDLVKGHATKPNLMILMPPRCAKTDLGVKAFTAWGLSVAPDSEWILTSYGQDLATANAVDVRTTLASDWYRETINSEYWGAHVRMRGQGAGDRQDYFYTEEGGCVKAIGSGGGITGFGAGKLRSAFGGCIVIDDPLKAQDRRSPAMRQAAIDYIENTLKSRRNRQDDPPTPIVLIMQRLHPQDPVGQLLQKERDKWDVLQIPAHDEQGRTIWQGRLNYDELMLIKESDPDTYWSDYMQEPSESHRSTFKESWWRFWRNLRAVEERTTLKMITADTAFEEKTSADWSVFQCWNVEGISGMYLKDQIRGQWEYPDLMKAAKEFWLKHTKWEIGITPCSEFWIENKASGIALVKTMRSIGIPARAWEPKDKTPKDKVGRAKHSTMPISAGRIFLPDYRFLGISYRWVEKFINEHNAFQDDMSHLNDDQVDAQTEASSIWQERGGGKGPIPEDF